MKKSSESSAPEVLQPVHEPSHPVRKQLFVSLSILLLLIAVTVLIILYGKGYRIFVQHGEPTISKTGILNLSSDPVGAQVYIDGHLTTATNNSLNLTPGKYS